MRFLRNLYDWVLDLANKSYGVIALFIISFIESIFFPIPPDVLLIPLLIGNKKKIFRFAFICSIGSILGACVGFFLGNVIWWNNKGEFSNIALTFFKYVPSFDINAFNNIKLLYDKYDFMIIFTAGFTPIPFKIFTISAGAFGLNFFMFILASTISRSSRFFLLAWLIKLFGSSITLFIDKYFNILSFIFTFLLITGFIIIKVLF